MADNENKIDPSCIGTRPSLMLGRAALLYLTLTHFDAPVWLQAVLWTLHVLCFLAINYAAFMQTWWEVDATIWKKTK